MRALAQARAAKVEAQNRPAQPEGWIVEGLHGVIDDLVVEGAAMERMRMADERGESRKAQSDLEGVRNY